MLAERGSGWVVVSNFIFFSLLWYNFQILLNEDVFLLGWNKYKPHQNPSDVSHYDVCSEHFLHGPLTWRPHADSLKSVPPSPGEQACLRPGRGLVGTQSWTTATSVVPVPLSPRTCSTYHLIRIAAFLWG